MLDLKWASYVQNVVIALDSEGVILYANAAVSHFFGYDPATLLGLKCHFDVLDAVDYEGKKIFITGVTEDKLVFVQHKHGYRVPAYLSQYKEETQGYFVQTMQIEDNALQKCALPVSLTDPLTGLAEAEYAEQWIDFHLKMLYERNETAGILIVDLDNFESLNQTYGRTVGDRTLKVAAQSIEGVSYEATLIARLRADEFLLFYPEIRVQALKDRAETLRIVLECTHLLGESRREIDMSASIGGVLAKHDEPWTQVKARVLQALKKAKSQDGNHTYVR